MSRLEAKIAPLEERTPALADVSGNLDLSHFSESEAAVFLVFWASIQQRIISTGDVNCLRLLSDAELQVLEKWTILYEARAHAA